MASRTLGGADHRRGVATLQRVVKCKGLVREGGGMVTRTWAGLTGKGKRLRGGSVANRTAWG